MMTHTIHVVSFQTEDEQMQKVNLQKNANSRSKTKKNWRKSQAKTI